MNKPDSNRCCTVMAVAVALAALAVAPLAAQNADDDASRLDRITVTPQKREEPLQEVPITLSVLSEQVLLDAGVRDIKDMQILVSGFSVTSTGNESQTTARIRGIGTVGDNPGLESSVGVVIDGVYRPRNGVAFGDLGEIERIEILKGPQGTVFGKNTSAGLINILTRRPGYSREAEGELSFGNYGAVGASGTYNDAIGQKAAFRLYLAKRERDGLLDVHPGPGPRTSTEDGTQDFHSVRAQLLLEPTPEVDINFIVDHTRRDEACCAAVTVVRGPTAAIVNALAGGPGVIEVADPSRRLAFANRDYDTDLRDQGFSAELNWRTPWFNEATLTSVTGVRDWRFEPGADIDFSGADIWLRPKMREGQTRFETFSQEIRLAGSRDRLDWMVGFFHSDEDMRFGFPIDLGPHYEPYLSIALISNIAASLAPLGIVVDTSNPALFLSEAAGRPFGTSFVGEAQRDSFEQRARGNALFTNLSFAASDQLDLTLGLRYTAERKTMRSSYRNPNGGPGCAAALSNPGQIGAALVARGVPASVAGSLVPTIIGNMCLPWANPLFDGLDTHQRRSEDEWSGTLRLAYKWSDGLMTYASASRGYKAGGFNQDRELLPNLTPDVDTSFPGEFVDAYELGFKSTWLDGNLLFNTALFYQDYSDFQLNTFLGTNFVVRSIPRLKSRGADVELIWQTGNGFMMQASTTYLDSRYGNDPLPDAGLALLPGSRASFAPRWSTSLSASYEHGLGAWLARWSLSARHVTDYNTGSDLLPEKVQKGFTLVNARIGIGSDTRRWSFELWAQNLTDRTYSQVVFNAPLQTGSFNAFLGAPRTYGATLRARF